VSADGLDRRGVVASAYVLALLGLLLPLAYLGALFAGFALLRRDRRGHGLAVIVLGAVCVVVRFALVS
jgi:hypothetical protein